MRYTAAFNGKIVLPEDQRTQYSMDFEDREHDNPLPRDGLPRITSEGLAILLEGLRGDFHRWKWAIGNHPLELPAGCARNFFVRAMEERPHFIAEFWTGLKWPRTKTNVRAMPHYCFDEVDDMVSKYATEPRAYITLRQTADHWAYAPVYVDAIELWADAIAAEDDGDGMVDCTACKPQAKVDKTPVTTLDAWMGAGQ